jgi:small subunit ribosomal protein S7
MSLTKEIANVRLFDRWDLDGVEVRDPGLKRYIRVGGGMLPHSGGRHEHHRFGKAGVPITERLVNNMMRHGRCGGKKAMAVNIVRSAFEIVHLRTGMNPVEVLVRAVENAAPCEDTTRVGYGGIVYRLAVDLAPQRRVDLALRFITEGARKVSFGNLKSIEECLADELILASRGDGRSHAVQKRNEMERVALSSR